MLCAGGQAAFALLRIEKRLKGLLPFRRFQLRWPYNLTQFKLRVKTQFPVCTRCLNSSIIYDAGWSLIQFVQV